MDLSSVKYPILVAALLIFAPAATAAGTTTPPNQFVLPTPLVPPAPSDLAQSYQDALQARKNLQAKPPTIKPPAVPASQEPSVQLVADVALQDCTFAQASATQGIHIVCNVTNKLGSQGDIRYGVELKRVGNVQEVVDAKVYEQALSLGKGQTMKLQFDYVPPKYLGGTYALWGVLETSDGLLLASNPITTVTLKATAASYLEIKPDTCTLHVRGEAATTTYAITRPVDVSPSEVLEGSCAVTAHAAGNITVTPSFTTYQRTVFGEVVKTALESQKSVTFISNETKTVSFIIPKASAPQAYIAVVSLVSAQGGRTVSNTASIPYVVRGASATIQNVFLDKGYYASGDTARVSVYWTGPETGTRSFIATSTAARILISMSDQGGASCAGETAFSISPDAMERSVLRAYPLRVTRLCVNPQATIKIVDAAGAPLAARTIAFSDIQIPASILQAELSKQRTVWYGEVIIGALLAVGAFIYMKRRIVV